MTDMPAPGSGPAARPAPAPAPAPFGAVLAGGASRRMGRPKAFVEVDGTAMARRVADTLAEAGCRPVVAIGGDAEAMAGLDISTVADSHPGEGPLGAIITALEHAAPCPVLVAACDLPWLDVATVAALIAARRDDIDVVAATTDRIEPLLSLWSPSALEHTRVAFAAGDRAVHVVLEGLRVHTVEVAPSALRNVNRPDDLLAGPSR
jgi:molybdopterin-guanine dinucleotide biosynthesis protein A